MSIYDEIDLTTARRDRARAKVDYEWALAQWRQAGRDRDKLKERVAEMEAVSDHADFFPYARNMFGNHVELLTGYKAPTVRYTEDDGTQSMFEVPDAFYGWLMGFRDSIPADPAEAT